jgi:hypothetical protein
MPRPARDPKLDQFWRRHLKRQAASGLTVRAYCRQHALHESSFYAWRRIIRERDYQPARPAGHPAPPSRRPAFLPVTVVDAQPPHTAVPIDIRLASGHRLRVRPGCDRALLAEVLAVLHPASRTEDRPC